MDKVNMIKKLKKGFLQKADFKHFLEENGLFVSPLDLELLTLRFDVN